MMPKQICGIVFGCFIPFHSGHQALVDAALDRPVDELIVAVCGSTHDRGEHFIPFNDRFELVKRKFYSNPVVTVVQVDDKRWGCDGTFSDESWKKWCTGLFHEARLDPFDDEIAFIWYTGEHSYGQTFGRILPGHDVVVLDRTRDLISGSAIRNDPKRFENKIDPVFADYLKLRGIL